MAEEGSDPRGPTPPIAERFRPADHRNIPMPALGLASHGDPTLAFDRQGRAVFVHMVDEVEAQHGRGYFVKARPKRSGR